MLTDDATNPRKRPTKNNIIEAMKWLVHNAQPNDSLVFHCKTMPIVMCDAFSDTYQILVTVVRLAILTAMRWMAMMKVSKLSAWRAFPMAKGLLVIYPMDYKREGHIVDDVRQNSP